MTEIKTDFKKGDFVKLGDTGKLYVIRGISAYYASAYDSTCVVTVDAEDIVMASAAEKESCLQFKITQTKDELRHAQDRVQVVKGKLDALHAGLWPV